MGLKGFHMPLRVCAYRNKGMVPCAIRAYRSALSVDSGSSTKFKSFRKTSE